jgi:hypothetical protein
VLTPLGIADWSTTPDGVRAELAIGPGRCTVLAEGWDTGTAAAAVARRSGAEARFVTLGAASAAVVETRTADAPLVLAAPRPPAACRVIVTPPPVPALDWTLPRCLAVAPSTQALDASAAHVAEELAAGRLPEALAAFAAAWLAAGGETPTTREAARLLLDHLARHPMSRDPALGAFIGTLLA